MAASIRENTIENREYARVLHEIAVLQRIVGETFFKVRAFERAARLIEEMATPVDELLDRRSIDLLGGIGESIEAELQALRVSGESPRHRDLLARTGPGVFDLLEIQGLGMKRLQTLFQQAGVADVPALKRAAEAGNLRGLPGFGAAIEEKLLSEIEHWEHTRGRRFPLPEAKGLADSIRNQLLELPEVDRAEVAGSIRRGRETIGDIDILVTTSHPELVASYFKSLPEVTEVVFDGVSRASVRVIGGIQVDLRVLEPHLFGAGMHYFTGSKEHHIQMRLRSKRLDPPLKISEHGVCRYDDPDEVPVGPMDTEEDVFAAVGLAYIPPEIRMGRDEIAAAESGTLPDLVEAASLRGDTRVCSSRSGGRDDVETLARRAVELGYSWLVVSERSRGVAEGGLDSQGLESWLRDFDEVRAAHPEIELVCGAEVAITDDGLLDLDHSLLSACGWVNATLVCPTDDGDDNTRRVVWAVETGLVSCLTSPTGRTLGREERPPLFFEEIVDACVDFGCALEMNGHPSRLDLNATDAARARERGASLALASGATSALALDNIEYAIQQARRAWIEKTAVLNTLDRGILQRAVRPLVKSQT